MLQRALIAIAVLSVMILVGVGLTLFHSRTPISSPLIAGSSQTQTFFKEKDFVIRSVVPSSGSAEAQPEYWVTVQADIRFTGAESPGHKSTDNYRWSLHQPDGASLPILGAKPGVELPHTQSCARGATCVFVWKPSNFTIQDLELRVYREHEKVEQTVPLRQLRLPASVKNWQFKALQSRVDLKIGEEAELPVQCFDVESLQLKVSSEFLTYRVEGLSSRQECRIFVKAQSRKTHTVVFKASNLNAVPSQLVTEMVIHAN